MTQEQRQRHGRGSTGITVYSDSHLGSVLYGKRPRMLEDEGLASLGEAKEKSKRTLKFFGKALLFPFLAIYSLGAAIFRKFKFASRDRKPVATVLVPYYKPQINTSGIAATFTAANATGDITLDDLDSSQPLLRRLAAGRAKRRAKSLEDEIFNSKARKGRRVKVAVLATAVLVVAAVGGYTGWWYNEGRFSTITISDNGNITEIRTAGETVEEVLVASGVALGENDMLNMHPSTEVREGLAVGIERAKNVTITTKEGEFNIEMAEGTVSDALNRASIHFDEDDEITPSLDTEISEGLHIRKVDVQVGYETKTEVIPFEEVTQDTNALYIGDTEIKEQGENGEKSIKERVVIRDGDEASREIIATAIDKEPINKLILNGTKEKEVIPDPVVVSSTGGSSSGSGGKSGGKSSSGNKSNSSSSGGSSGGSSSGSSVAAPAGGPSADQIASTMTVDFITAYTHTGNKTSTGVWPSVGMCAVNPNKIPYGTRLYIPGYGYAVAADTGSFTSGRNAIDVFLDTEAECRKWGRKYSITVYICK